MLKAYPCIPGVHNTRPQHGRGYIVDVSLKGTSVEPDADDMEAAYGEGTSPADVLQARYLCGAASAGGTSIAQS